jgi:hypothetical protein
MGEPIEGASNRWSPRVGEIAQFFDQSVVSSLLRSEQLMHAPAIPSVRCGSIADPHKLRLVGSTIHEIGLPENG